MSKELSLIAVSNRKGGVGRSALTVMLSSYLHFEKNLNVAIIDYDSPQHSLVCMRERDKKATTSSAYFQQLLQQQWNRVSKKTYLIVGSTLERARETADELAASGDYDLIFVDLPGTVESTGVFRTIVNMGYTLIPTTPDPIIMQSTLVLSTTVLDHVKNTKDAPLKDILFSWNKLRKRTNVETCKFYAEVMRELYLTVLDTKLPDLCRYEKEITHVERGSFCCTLLPLPPRQLEGSGLKELAGEFIVKLKLEHA